MSEEAKIEFELVPAPVMDWHCCRCHQNFPCPTDRAPKDGCPTCGSLDVFDINIGPIGPNNPRLS
jgi:Zn finger protein HypA/HybF involved in hydrogenase expression